VLPDFLIGAHAAVTGRQLLTRDPGRIATHIPGARLIAPAPGNGCPPFIAATSGT